MARLALSTTILAVLVASITACGRDSGGPAAEIAALRELVGAAGDVDYEPLRSPAEAVQASDVIVLGEVVGATLASHVVDAAADREMRYIILTVAVRTVLAGVLPEPAGSVVYVALRAAGIDPAVEIEEAVPKLRTLLILDDRSGWQPPGELKGFPGTFYEPFTDGAWFEAGDSFEGLWVDRTEIEERWGESLDSLDDLAELLRVTAAQ